MPKFSVKGVWQRWRESYPAEGTKADDAITVFTGVSITFSVMHGSITCLSFPQYLGLCMHLSMLEYLCC